MHSDRYDLSRLLDIPGWETIQDRIGEITGTAIMTVDFRGDPVTKYSRCTPFCAAIRADPQLCRQCSKCNAVAALEAVRSGCPALFRCHCGIGGTAVAVVENGIYLGAVLVGQILLTDGDYDRIVSPLPGEEALPEELEQLRDRLPRMSAGQLMLAARTVEDILRYVTADRQSGPVEHPSAEAAMPMDQHSPVYPALVYIDAHLDQRIGLEEMATLCGLSCSYFSRVFCRDVGEGFRDYLNRRRIEEAKKLLEEQDATVSQVSDRLGFTDISYFVKVFKKYEGITPKSYIHRMSRQQKGPPR